MDGVHITQELADEYAIGSLDPGTERLILLHVAGCDRCRALAREAERYAAALALGVATRPVPGDLKQRVMVAAGISRPTVLQRSFTVVRALGGVAAVAVAAAAFAGMVAMRGDVGSLRNQNAALQREVDQALSQRVEIAALTQRLTRAEEVALELTEKAAADRDLLIAQMSPDSRVADVVGVSEFVTAVGRLVWDQDQFRVWFVAANLPPRASGETYELWVSTSGRWISLGTFNTDSTGFGRLETTVPEGLREYESAVVTIERAGSTERSGPSVFVTDLSGLRR